MKKALLVTGIILLMAIAYVIGRTNPGDEPILPINPASIGAQCGIEQCHGFNLTCGTDVPEACTEMYQAGDGCRSFFECGITDTPDGRTQCAPAPNEKFKLCKACVQKCESDFAGDPEKVFRCDSACSTDTYE